ncbi:MAG: hypothetical protein ACKODX_01260 [Gemmata sp.]
MPRLLAAIVLLSGVSGAFGADHPHVVIKVDKLRFTLYEADAKAGFYRGTRFDHAGVFGNVEFAGHTLFGPWKGAHDPANHDDIVGPCDEFGIENALGYDDAKPGETFLKIGVGELEKPKEVKYSPFAKYKVVRPLEWKRAGPDPRAPDRAPAARWQGWTTDQKANSYGYQFSKFIMLDETAAAVGIGYKLKNTGAKRIVTDFYNHNFFNVDRDPVGPNYSLAFGFEPKAQDLKGKFGDLVELKGTDFRFRDKLPAGQFVMAGLTGYDARQREHRTFEMRHAPSGIAVKVEHSYPFARLNVWGINTTICPEPFLAINLKPGEETEWGIAYTFTREKR